ncbi:MAG: hypothetical protein M0P12_01345 [Paludibacteraceae bacterium]|nr:hypothetical protein [Paludibacteraceae bacterium]
MKYFWSTVIGSGFFDFWEAINEDDVKKKIVKKYCGKVFDFGETTESSYRRFTKEERND